MQSPVFIHPIRIRESDIDAMGHVNNVVYLQWVQEAATAHWQSLASETIRQTYLWVVVRHEIDYLAPAFLNTAIEAHTWVGGHRGATSERFVDIIDKASKKILAKAKTTWCLLRADMLRPTKINADIITLFGSPAKQ